MLILQCRGKWRFCLQLMNSFFNTFIWIPGLTVLLLVQGAGEMAVLPAVTAVMLHHIPMDTWTDCNVVSSR